MEQNNTQSPPAAKSTARYVFFGFLVVGLIVFIIGFSLANFNVSMDRRIVTYDQSKEIVISEKKNVTEAKSGLINVKENLIRDLKIDFDDEYKVDSDKYSVIKDAITTADSRATIALLAYILAIISAVGLIAIDAVQVFFGKNNKILKIAKVACFLLFFAAAACAVITYEVATQKFYYAVRGALSHEIGKSPVTGNIMRYEVLPHTGSDFATLFGMVGAIIVFIGFIAIPLARAYKKRYSKKRNK